MSGKEAGIYAITKILNDPLEVEEDEAEKNYWLKTTKETKKLLRVILKIIKRLLNNPIFRYELKDIEGLQNFSILRFAQGTNFPVKDNELEIISKLITKSV